MNEVLRKFADFVEASDPRFVCKHDHGTEEYVAIVRHELERHPTPDELEMMAEAFEGLVPDDVEAFYSFYGGASLFKGSVLSSRGYFPCGLRIGRICEWAGFKACVEENFDSIPDFERDDAIPSWFETAVAFGEVPDSGNYLLMGTVGAERGQIFYFESEDISFKELAPSLEGLLKAVISKPIRMIKLLGSLLRFEDEESFIQWRPVKYVTGA